MTGDGKCWTAGCPNPVEPGMAQCASCLDALISTANKRPNRFDYTRRRLARDLSAQLPHTVVAADLGRCHDCGGAVDAPGRDLCFDCYCHHED